MKTNLKLFSLTAVLLSSLVACEDSERVSYSEVTLNVNIPAALTTKSISDGTKANTLYWEAFDASGNPLGFKGKTDISTTSPAVINVNLLKYVEYNFVFWAHCVDPSGNHSAYDLIDFYDNGKVSVSYEGLANDENRDAFYAHEPIIIDDTQASRNKVVSLTRPFAQINFLALDYQAVESIGAHESLTSTISVSGLPNVLDGKNGTVSGDATTALRYSAVPTGTDAYYVLNDGNATRCGWYSMNYVLSADTRTENLTVVGNFKHDKSAEEIVLTVENVPYERNFRTNIIGNFFTESAALTVKIDPNFIDKNGDGEPDDIIKDLR